MFLETQCTCLEILHANRFVHERSSMISCALSIIGHAITVRQLRLLQEADLTELGFRLGQRWAVLDWIEKGKSQTAQSVSTPLDEACSPSSTFIITPTSTVSAPLDAATSTSSSSIIATSTSTRQQRQNLPVA